MREFRIRKDGYPTIRNQLFKLFIAKIFIFCVIILFINSTINSYRFSIQSWASIILSGFLIISVDFLVRLYQKKKWVEKYSLSLADGSIFQELENKVMTSIYIKDIIKIAINIDGSLSIIDANKKKIDIPYQIDNYYDLKELLSNFSPLISNDIHSKIFRIIKVGILIFLFLLSFLFKGNIYLKIFWLMYFLFIQIDYIDFLKSNDILELRKRNSLILFGVLVLMLFLLWIRF